MLSFVFYFIYALIIFLIVWPNWKVFCCCCAVEMQFTFDKTILLYANINIFFFRQNILQIYCMSLSVMMSLSKRKLSFFLCPPDGNRAPLFCGACFTLHICFSLLVPSSEALVCLPKASNLLIYRSGLWLDHRNIVINSFLAILE